MQKTSNLAVATRANGLAVSIYRLTQALPTSERYGLTAQMRRAVVSIGSNIAEGCGRTGDPGLAAFLQIALGSASELEFQLRLTADLGLLSPARVTPALAELRQVTTMLTRLTQSLRRAPPRHRVRAS